MADSGKMDSRFASMFKDEEFVIDPTSERAQLLKPVCKSNNFWNRQNYKRKYIESL